MPQEIQIPESAAALRALQDNATFEKLARDWNIHPQNQAEADQLLEIGNHLVAAKVQGTKTASDTGSPFLAGVLDEIKGTMRDEGFQTGPTAREALFKEAANRLVDEDETIAKAAIEWADYLAQVEAASA